MITRYFAYDTHAVDEINQLQQIIDAVRQQLILTA